MTHGLHDPIGADDGAAGADYGTGAGADDGAAFGAVRIGTTGASAPSMVLFLKEPGDATAISVNDLHQGQIGDCFLISSIGELALKDPSAIANMIQTNADGSETVKLFIGANGRLPTFGTNMYKQVAVKVTNVFPSYSVNNGAFQDMVAGQKEIWPQVLEKAVATLDGGYGAISNGGNPAIAMEELTGHQAIPMSSSAVTLQSLQSWIAAGDLVTMDTYASSALPYNLVGSHAYMFEKLTMTNGTPTVQLGNPWGTDQPGAIPLSQLTKGIAEVDVGRFA